MSVYVCVCLPMSLCSYARMCVSLSLCMCSCASVSICVHLCMFLLCDGSLFHRGLVDFQFLCNVVALHIVDLRLLALFVAVFLSLVYGL